MQIKSMDIEEIINGLIWAQYDFLLKVKSVGVLPEYKGSLIRGAFGSELKKMSCVMPKNKSCLNCAVNDSCIYAKTFESVNEPPKTDKFLSNTNHIPHPFIIRDNTNMRQSYVHDDDFKFQFVLISKNYIDKLPYYIFAFKNAFENGVGMGRKIKMTLHSVDVNNKDEICKVYDGEKEKIDKTYKEKYYKSDDIINKSKLIHSNRLTIEFISPTRLNSEKKEQNINFKTFITSILRRLSGIASNYFNKDVKIDAKEFLKEAEEVKTEAEALTWYDWERKSARQGKIIKMGGLKGQIKFTGSAIAKYLPLIKLGEHFHIGKWTAFGMGQYVVRDY
jgi:CRISPR-associated endoribonuclease Cas6